MKPILYSLLFCFVTIQSFSQAQAGTSLRITNEDNKTVTFSLPDIQAMPHLSVDIKAHDGNMHSYEGVLLMNLLKKADVPLGDSAKKNVVSSYVLITAADDYKAVYALSEIDTLQSEKTIILADKIDGKPLPQNALPYQIIATGEKIHARMIRQVISLAVRKAM